jgi:hypothetical protein
MDDKSNYNTLDLQSKLQEADMLIIQLKQDLAEAKDQIQDLSEKQTKENEKVDDIDDDDDDEYG